jgi:hypothetical protein
MLPLLSITAYAEVTQNIYPKWSNPSRRYVLLNYKYDVWTGINYNRLLYLEFDNANVYMNYDSVNHTILFYDKTTNAKVNLNVDFASTYSGGSEITNEFATQYMPNATLEHTYIDTGSPTGSMVYNMKLMDTNIVVKKDNTTIYTPPPPPPSWVSEGENGYIVFEPEGQISVDKSHSYIFQYWADTVDKTKINIDININGIVVASLNSANMTGINDLSGSNISSLLITQNTMNVVNKDSGGQWITGQVNWDFSAENNMAYQIGVIVTNIEKNTQFGDTHDITIKAFTDGNNDGLDDTTGEVQWQGMPRSWSPEDIDNEASIKALVRTLKETFQGLQDGLSVISAIVKIIFNFLPVQLLGLIILILVIIGVTTILKILRG